MVKRSSEPAMSEEMPAPTWAKSWVSNVVNKVGEDELKLRMNPATMYDYIENKVYVSDGEKWNEIRPGDGRFSNFVFSPFSSPVGKIEAKFTLGSVGEVETPDSALTINQGGVTIGRVSGLGIPVVSSVHVPEGQALLTSGIDSQQLFVDTEKARDLMESIWSEREIKEIKREVKQVATGIKSVEGSFQFHWSSRKPPFWMSCNLGLKVGDVIKGLYGRVLMVLEVGDRCCLVRPVEDVNDLDVIWGQSENFRPKNLKQ